MFFLKEMYEYQQSDKYFVLCIQTLSVYAKKFLAVMHTNSLQLCMQIFCIFAYRYLAFININALIAIQANTAYTDNYIHTLAKSLKHENK